MNLGISSLGIALGLASLLVPDATAQEVLPFPPTPSASTPGLTMQDSVHRKRQAPARLRDGAPNVLIILLDDVGPGVASTFGGEVRTPTLDRIANAGIAYNRFHSTAMCSPTRAALLTGRNHTRVGNGQICELANDWDGFSGTIPKSSATVATVLKEYGYNTGAWGKWHNTPAEQTTSKGPFEYWPTGYGFEYFYGFLAGEASQYEPRLVRNTTIVAHPPAKSGGNDHYHLTEDLADDAIAWLREQQAFSPDKPFLMYWATGASHGPHHIMKEWADRYRGKFDDGWDKYRERVFANAKAKGWIPANAQLTPRPASLPAWDSIPEAEKPFQRRLMELWAGFTEHADHHAGRIVDEIAAQGRLDNTLIFYLVGDNGNSAEGQNGTISELLAQNGIPTTIGQHLQALEQLGGLDVLGSPKTDNHYHAAWAWAGSAPYRSTKLVAAHFGGTRQNLAVAWPKGIRPDAAPRAQFHHVVDVVPTIYEVAGVQPPRVVHGLEQDPIDGVSMVYTFADAKAEGQRKTQFFDVMGSRGIYDRGWFACTFGPRTPWVPGRPQGIESWNPENDVWELYNLDEDWTQANDLAARMPEKLQQLKSLFLVESAKNGNLPIGGGLWTPVLHPEDAPSTPYTEWTFRGPITGMPEFAAPKLGRIDNVVTMEIEVPAEANGVLYALGGFSAGLACYVQGGKLCYEYNLFEIQRTHVKAQKSLPAGKVKVEVTSRLAERRPGAPLDVELKVNGEVVAQGRVPISVPLAFTAQDCLDIGSDLGSPVSIDYYDLAPFRFNGVIHTTRIAYPRK
jgi:arylsulfatase